MSTLKTILGLCCAVVAFFLGIFAWASFRWGPLWFKFVPIGFTVGLLVTGLFLILKRNSPLSKNAKNGGGRPRRACVRRRMTSSLRLD